VVVAAALALSACSSSSNTTASSTPAASDTSSSSAAPSSSAPSAPSGVDAAKAYIEPFLKNPTSIVIDTPLSKKPATGKLIVGLDSGTDSALVLASYWKQAAEDLGWTYKDINSGFTPEDQQKAMDSAIALNPAGIATSGITIQTIKTQLDTAAQKGIWVNTSASTDQPTGAFFDTSIASPAELGSWGKMIAAYVVSTTPDANIEMFSLPPFPILLEYDKSFVAALTEWCPTCVYKDNPQQGTDIGTKTPGSVVSRLQANPKANWLSFDLGDLATGVDAAITAAGLDGQAKIGGLTATKANIAAVKAGKENAWTAYSLPIVGYRQIDSFARKFNGDPIVNAVLPTQTITPDNVNGLVLDDKGNYLGVADYQAQFKKLWLVG
jgi:ribose transport system substrate-binding protein